MMIKLPRLTALFNFSRNNTYTMPDEVQTSPELMRPYSCAGIIIGPLSTSRPITALRDKKIGTWKVIDGTRPDIFDTPISYGEQTPRMLDMLCYAEIYNARARGYENSLQTLVETRGPKEKRSHILNVCQKLCQSGKLEIRQDELVFKS